MLKIRKITNLTFPNDVIRIYPLPVFHLMSSVGSDHTMGSKDAEETSWYRSFNEPD